GAAAQLPELQRDGRGICKRWNGLDNRGLPEGVHAGQHPGRSQWQTPAKATVTSYFKSSMGLN
ncbi:MAG: hypothetical protein Q7U14_03400, partial [Lacisediminimonas sp.]|nr:hypothetical protein [Lacisediminimonas sp.]